VKRKGGENCPMGVFEIRREVSRPYRTNRNENQGVFTGTGHFWWRELPAAKRETQWGSTETVLETVKGGRTASNLGKGLCRNQERGRGNKKKKKALKHLGGRSVWAKKRNQTKTRGSGPVAP